MLLRCLWLILLLLVLWVRQLARVIWLCLEDNIHTIVHIIFHPVIFLGWTGSSTFLCLSSSSSRSRSVASSSSSSRLICYAGAACPSTLAWFLLCHRVILSA